MPDTLAARIRAKYPGAYDDLSDAALEKAIDAKYPGAYDDVPRTKAPLVDPKTGTEYKPGTMVGLPPKGARVVGETPEGYLVQGDNWMQTRQDPSRNPELNRADNSVLGLPPELAVVSGVGVARAAASAAGGAGAKAIAGAKEVASQATPAIKYEVTKSTLEHLGVPPLVAMPIAMAVAGYKRGSKASAPAPATAPTAASEPMPAAAPKVAPAATPAPATAPVAEDAMARMNRLIDEAKAKPFTQPTVAGKTITVQEPAPAAPTPAQTAPSTPTVAPKSTLSASQIADQVQKAAAKARVDLSPSEHVKAFRMVRDEGVTAADAVAKVGGTPRPVTVPAAGLQMTASEVKEYVRLVKAGKTQAEAVSAIKALRKLAGVPGAMSTEQMESEIAARVGNRSPTR